MAVKRKWGGREERVEGKSYGEGREGWEKEIREGRQKREGRKAALLCDTFSQNFRSALTTTTATTTEYMLSSCFMTEIQE